MGRGRGEFVKGDDGRHVGEARQGGVGLFGEGVGTGVVGLEMVVNFSLLLSLPFPLSLPRSFLQPHPPTLPCIPFQHTKYPLLLLQIPVPLLHFPQLLFQQLHLLSLLIQLPPQPCDCLFIEPPLFVLLLLEYLVFGEGVVDVLGYGLLFLTVKL